MKMIQLTETINAYIEDHAPLPHPILTEVYKETKKRGDARMQISRAQGSFLNLICRLLGVRNAVEVGCFTGYSAICIASALDGQGALVTLDVNPETMNVAKGFFERAGLSHVIHPRLGDARVSLAEMAETESNSVDFAFIDADKTGYETYYERCLQLLRPGGLIAVDNVLWSGKVCDMSCNDADTEALRAFNAARRRDDRVDAVMVNVADGLYLLRKR